MCLGEGSEAQDFVCRILGVVGYREMIGLKFRNASSAVIGGICFANV